MKTHVVGSQSKLVTADRSHECQLARKQPWTWLQKQSPDVAAWCELLWIKLGNWIFCDAIGRLVSFLNAVAVDLPWGKLDYGEVFCEETRNSEMLAGLLIGRRASQWENEEVSWCVFIVFKLKSSALVGRAKGGAFRVRANWKIERWEFLGF